MAPLLFFRFLFFVLHRQPIDERLANGERQVMRLYENEYQCVIGTRYELSCDVICVIVQLRSCEVFWVPAG